MREGRRGGEVGWVLERRDTRGKRGYDGALLRGGDGACFARGWRGLFCVGAGVRVGGGRSGVCGFLPAQE